jgi:hypothetical protein
VLALPCYAIAPFKSLDQLRNGQSTDDTLLRFPFVVTTIVLMEKKYKVGHGAAQHAIIEENLFLGLPKELKKQIFENLNFYDLIMLRSSCKSWFNLILDFYAFAKWFVLDQQACASYFVSIGSISCLEYLKSLNFFFSSELVANAAGSRHFDVVKFLHKHGCPLDELAACEAARVGSLEILKYCIENSFPKNYLKQNFGSAIMYQAINYGHLHVLQYLHENGIGMTSILTHVAASRNYLDCLKYALDHGCLSSWAQDGAGPFRSIEAIQLYLDKGFPKHGWKSFACKYAAKLGDLQMLKWVHDNGAPWNDAIMKAIAKGSLSCVQYMVENGVQIENTVTIIGSVQVLAYLVECTTAKIDTSEIYQDATKSMNKDILAYLSSRSFVKPASLALTAAETRNFDFFKWCIEELKFDTRPKMNTTIMPFDIFGAAFGNYDIMKYVVEKKLGPNIQPYSWYVDNLLPYYPDVRIWRLMYDLENFEITDSLLHNAAARGTPELLEWLAECGAKFEEEHVASVAVGNNLACMAYLIKQGCEFSIGFAGGKQLCNKYAYEHGYPWSPDAVKHALTYLDLLRYMVHCGQVKLDSNLYKMAAERRADKCLYYLEQQGVTASTP